MYLKEYSLKTHDSRQTRKNTRLEVSMTFALNLFSYFEVMEPFLYYWSTGLRLPNPFANIRFLIRFYFRWWSHNHQHYTRNWSSKEIIETIKNLNRIPHWPSALDGQLNQPSPAPKRASQTRTHKNAPGPLDHLRVRFTVSALVRARAHWIAQSRDNARLCPPVRPPAAADLWTTDAFTRPLKKARD